MEWGIVLTDFNAVAAGWDTERRTKRAGIIADVIAGSLQSRKVQDALEFGCGTGLISFILRDRFHRITLVDPSGEMIRTLENKIRDAGVQNMTPLREDVCNRQESRVPEESADVIYTSMAFHHVRDTEGALKALFGILRPGGRICIVDLTEDDGSFHRLEKDFDGHNGFDQEQLAALLKKTGFRNVSSRVFFEDVREIGAVNVPYSLFLMTGDK